MVLNRTVTVAGLRSLGLGIDEGTNQLRRLPLSAVVIQQAIWLIPRRVCKDAMKGKHNE